MAQNEVPKTKKFTSLRRKLIVAILFISSVITLFTTALQFYFEYQRDLSYLDQTLSHIGNSNSSTLSRSLWNLDDLQIKVQLDSILKIRDIINVGIYDEEGRIVYESIKEGYSNVEKFSIKFPLTLTEDIQVHRLGELVIWATKVHINKDLISKLTNFFLGQFVKTLIIIFAMLYIFRFLITKHLDFIVNFLRKSDLNSQKIERLHLAKIGDNVDELDYVKDSINNMLERVERGNSETIQKIQRQEREIQLQKAASINSARLASLGEMAANIAHEINNPLTVLRFSGNKMLNLLNDKEINRSRLIYFTEMNNRTVDRMSKTITSLKRLSRDTSDESFEVVSIVEMVERVLDLYEMSLNEKGIKLSTDYLGLDSSTYVRCQEVKVTQVIINLLNNAKDEVKSMENPWIKLVVEMSDSKVSFSVVDSGRGIPKDIAERVFEPFFTTKNIGEGTGLGLSISATTAEEHNGRIFLDNSKSNTTITFEFPHNL